MIFILDLSVLSILLMGIIWSWSVSIRNLCHATKVFRIALKYVFEKLQYILELLRTFNIFCSFLKSFSCYQLREQ